MAQRGSLPRACGGDPYAQQHANTGSGVFPAHAGVIQNFRRLPTGMFVVFPAHAGVIQGCLASRLTACLVFPAHAGVIPSGLRVTACLSGLPRACGGDPDKCRVA